VTQIYSKVVCRFLNNYLIKAYLYERTLVESICSVISENVAGAVESDESCCTGLSLMSRRHLHFSAVSIL
jgi:hypothetical protein